MASGSTTMASETPRRISIPGGFGAGVGAAIAMMLVMALLRFTTNTISIPELMEGSLIHLTGGEIESTLINALGVGGKAILLVTIVEGTLLLGGLLGLAFTRFWPLNRTGSSWHWTSGLLYGLLVGLLLNVVVLPIFGQGLFGTGAVGVTAPAEISRAIYGTALAPFGLPVFLSIFLLSVVFGLALVYLLPWNHLAVAGREVASARPTSVERGVESEGRRDFMKALGGVGLAVVGGAALWAVIRQALQPPSSAGLQEVDVSGNPSTTPSTPVAGTTPAATTTAAAGAEFANVKAVLVPEITPTDSFYITTKNFVDPTVDGNAWQLTFKGLVDSPYTMNLKDVMSMPTVSKVHTLACISNPVGGSLIGNANWKGIDFAALLRKAGPKSNATEVIVRAADGYEDSFPLDVALNSGVVLAYEMNGQSLVTKHGYPVRLLVPNIYGMKNCKWLTEVELTDHDFFGYWESQGWDDVAHYQTMSRIDYPDSSNINAKPLYIGGIAFAGNRGIRRVEVSTDNGNSWADAQLRKALGRDTWVQWTFPWNPKAGGYVLQVRATDGTGAVQTSQQQDTYPRGATGYDTRTVRVG